MNVDQLRGTSAAVRTLAAGPWALMLAAIPWLASGCAGGADADTQAEALVQPGLRYQIDLPVSHPPYDTFHASWRVRLEEGYVFLEHYGSYTDTGAHIPALLREMRVQGIEPTGAPFCLFYSDPATTSRDRLYSRACVPIAGVRSPRTPLDYDVLPPVSVAYAYVSGPYPDVPRAYPRLSEWMGRLNWTLDGPILARYIVPPTQAASTGDYLCEIQMPGAVASR
ncbi:MAG: GyrI-like domain-containing protein [Planctomycetota bacterium]|nr:GyrI-like domain-containing protein [Planctomycetota bacterium]